MERRLAAVLAADIVGYSRLIGLDEEGTLMGLNALKQEVIEPAISAHRGRDVKPNIGLNPMKAARRLGRTGKGPPRGFTGRPSSFRT